MRGRLFGHLGNTSEQRGRHQLSSFIGGCKDRQAGRSLLRMRLAQVATCNSKDPQRVIIALNETPTEGLGRNVVLYTFGDS